MRSTIWVAVGALGLWAVGAGAAEGVRWEIGLGPSFGEGEVRYEIGRWVRWGGETEALPFPLSRLEFPIRAVRAEGWLRVQAGSAWEAWVRSGRTLTEDAGTTRDYDWDYPAGQPLLAIYSESDARYSAWALEGGLRWWFGRWARPGNQEWAVALGAGWARQSHEWEARDGVQIYPATPEVPPDAWEGVAVNYALVTDLPFAELALRLSQPKVRLEGRVFLSPFARVQDRDDHLLRGIRAETDADGIAVGAEIALQYWISRHWYVLASARWWQYEADGHSNNVVYGPGDEELQLGEQWTIYEEIRGEEFLATLGVGARW